MNTMRIDQTLSGQAVQETMQSEGAAGAGGDEGFALLLQNEIAGQKQETAPAGNSICEVGGSQALSGLWELQSPVLNSGQSPEMSKAISALDGIISQFDSLQNELKGAKSPKEINALIEQINAQTSGLDEKMSGLPSDHQLRDLGEELKITAYMESVKLSRGDYL